MFRCDKCVECCRTLDKSRLYEKLDRGDGVRKYLRGNLCSIYEKSPLLCRVDESYDPYFKDKYLKEEYYRLNCQVCEQLKSQRRN